MKPSRITSPVLFLALLSIVLPRQLFAAKPAWVDSVEVSTGTILSSKHELPFWLWANKDGRVPQAGNSSFTRLRVTKQSNDRKQFDWMYGFDATWRSNDTQPPVRWTDAWAGIAYKKVRFTAGRKSEIIGLADTLLTAGPEVYSRNAPTIPKIAISTRGYVGLTNNLSVNAGLAHGWFGNDPFTTSPWLQEKYLFFRLGDTWPDDGVNFYAGIHDNCIWGGNGQPSSFSDFLRVLRGRSGGSSASESDQQNTLGDHKGTLETALQFKGSDRDWYFYGMSMYDDNIGLRLFQPGDWLIGASLIFKDPDSRVQRINIECLDTRVTTGGSSEAIFWGQYGGWVHEGYGICTPFIPFIQRGNQWYPLNQVKAYNAAVLTRFTPMLNPLIRVSWLHVYGSDVTSQIPSDKLTRTVSLDVANTMHLDRSWSLKQEVSADFSDKATPNWGAMFSISKSWF
ncbi:MAG: capsule assembly Wzi family protein [Chlorobiaceae bacterium]|nr:capsule assembly Wzi family protein [Chlorobiaceae bacterium]